MRTTTHTKPNSWLLVPVTGILLFIGLYIVAACYYPGGSQADAHSTGFSWINNYWCNLLNENAINGQRNTARPIALTAMVILSFTLAIFWYLFPVQAGLQKALRITIQVSGVLAALIGLFIFTSYHDTITNLASLCGLIATTGTFIGLYKLKWTKLFGLGILNLLLVAINNLLYYSNGLLSYLPLVQKITFLSFLVWICGITIGLYRKKSHIH